MQANWNKRAQPYFGSLVTLPIVAQKVKWIGRARARYYFSQVSQGKLSSLQQQLWEIFTPDTVSPTGARVILCWDVLLRTLHVKWKMPQQRKEIHCKIASHSKLQTLMCLCMSQHSIPFTFPFWLLSGFHFLTTSAPEQQKCMHKSVFLPVCPSPPVLHLIFKPTGQFLLSFTEKDVMVKMLTRPYKMCACMCA